MSNILINELNMLTYAKTGIPASGPVARQYFILNLPCDCDHGLSFRGS